MKGCLGSILSFIFGLFLLVIVWKSGIWVYFKDAIDILQNGFTAPDYNKLFNI